MYTTCTYENDSLAFVSFALCPPNSRPSLLYLRLPGVKVFLRPEVSARIERNGCVTARPRIHLGEVGDGIATPQLGEKTDCLFLKGTTLYHASIEMCGYGQLPISSST